MALRREEHALTTEYYTYNVQLKNQNAEAQK